MANDPLVVEGPSDTALISFREGKLAYSQMGKDDNSLAAILFRSNNLTQAQHKMIKTRAGNMSDKELGLLLINANYISQDDILGSLQTEFIGIIHRLFTWVEGLFRFENGVLPPDDKITLKIGLENIIIEGTRHLREWEQLHDEIPSLEVALNFTDRPGVNLKNINLSVEEWRVVSYINPKNSVKQIAKTTKMNDLEIRRIVYGLLQAGLVELVRPVSLTVPAAVQHGVPAIPGRNEDEQKSLVNRIINRIRSL